MAGGKWFLAHHRHCCEACFARRPALKKRTYMTLRTGREATIRERGLRTVPLPETDHTAAA